jgi:hypothetical protein
LLARYDLQIVAHRGPRLAMRRALR